MATPLKSPTPMKKKRKMETEQLKAFSNWETWEKRGWDSYQAFQDNEMPKTSKGKCRGKNCKE